MHWTVRRTNECSRTCDQRACNYPSDLPELKMAPVVADAEGSVAFEGARKALRPLSHACRHARCLGGPAQAQLLQSGLDAREDIQQICLNPHRCKRGVICRGARE